MEFIGAYWWVWLLMVVISGAYASCEVIKRKKITVILTAERMAKCEHMEVTDEFDQYYASIAPFFIATIVCCVSGGIFILSVVVNLFNYFVP